MKVLVFLNSIILGLFFVTSLQAAELNGVKFDDTIKVGEESLHLNGLSIREVKKAGFPIKVYVGGLYVKEKTTEAAKVLASESVKKIVMKFTFFAPKGKIKKAWKDAFKDQCDSDCRKVNSVHMKGFLKSLKFMRSGDITSFTIYKDRLVVKNIKGKKEEVSEIKSGTFATVILKSFISAPIKKFRDGFFKFGKETKPGFANL